jgi:GAF domain-containing protein
MVSELQYQVARAVRSGASLGVIERTIIETAPLDEEHRAALWLYAEALRDRPGAALAYAAELRLISG